MLPENLYALPLEQQIGQFLFIGLPGTEFDAEARALVEEVQPGGVIIFGRNVAGPEQLRSLLDAVREVVPTPPLFGIDQEGGLVDRLRRIFTPMPSARTIRQHGDLAAARALGRVTGEVLRMLGFNINFAPVMSIMTEDRDLLSNGLYSRSFGRSPGEVLGYSTVEAGAAILPAAFCMVLVAPRSAKLIEAKGSRFTLLTGYVFCFLGFVTMLLLWGEGSAYWEVAVGYSFVGIGVGFAGTPASHSLTGSVPVNRAGMASATSDLQRDLGGAIMQSILGALLTAGYAAAMTTAVASAPNSSKITNTTQDQLQQSFGGAENVAKQFPQYANQISAAAKSSFLDGANWAYAAGIIAVLVGATLVFFMFPKKAEEESLLRQYHDTDFADSE